MPRTAAREGLPTHTNTSGAVRTPPSSAESEEDWLSPTPDQEDVPDSQPHEYGPAAERCATYLHQIILRGDPFDENILAGWPDKMEFLLRETGFSEDKFKDFLVFVFREQINDEKHDHLNSVLWLNAAKDPAASLKKNGETLAHRYGGHLKAKKIEANRRRK